MHSREFHAYFSRSLHRHSSCMCQKCNWHDWTGSVHSPQSRGNLNVDIMTEVCCRHLYLWVYVIGPCKAMHQAIYNISWVKLAECSSTTCSPKLSHSAVLLWCVAWPLHGYWNYPMTGLSQSPWMLWILINIKAQKSVMYIFLGIFCIDM